MLISINWINDFVDLSGLDIENLIERFTLSTAEVEEVMHKGKDISGIVAAKILSVEDHPDSKKLHLLKVDSGDGVYDIVCGAPNVRAGMIVPLAKLGARIGEMTIAVATLAGYESHGMCCSESELGISDDHGGLMELPEDTVLGTDIKQLYAIDDIIFEVDNKSLTNRPDLWGHYGIAREFAALTGRELKPLELLDLSTYDSLPEVSIKILDTENCYRYSSLKVRNITTKISPVDMRIRLFYCGTRAINLLADLTNYLMLEMGQPMHAFDSRKVDCVEIKRFDKPFAFQTLDGEERTIDENTLMITSKDEPVAIAGIMGGLASEIEDDTDSLLLESANFDAVCVRKSSTRLGLRTDASMRYEKTLDPEMTLTAVKRFMKLLSEIDTGFEVVSALSDVYAKKYPQIDITFDKHYVDRYTGIEISNEEILKTLSALGFGAKLEGGNFNISVPSWRATKDVTIKADIIEEITRIYGYDNFVIETTRSALLPVLDTPQRSADGFTKDILVSKYNLHEVNSYIWCDNKKWKALGLEVEDNVRLVNAMTTDNETLRNCIVPTLLSYTSDNKAYSQDFGLFEIARIVDGLKPDGNCYERKKLGIVLFSKTESEQELYYKLLRMIKTLGSDIKHVSLELKSAAAAHSFQHPTNTAEISYEGRALGFVSTLHPSVLQKIDRKAVIVVAELDMDDFAAIETASIPYVDPSKYPGIEVDLSLVSDEGTDYADMKAAWEGKTDLLKSVSLIDMFEADGIESVTLRLSFSSNEKTLSREELQPVIDDIIKALDELGAKLKV